MAPSATVLMSFGEFERRKYGGCSCRSRRSEISDVMGGELEFANETPVGRCGFCESRQFLVCS